MPFSRALRTALSPLPFLHKIEMQSRPPYLNPRHTATTLSGSIILRDSDDQTPANSHSSGFFATASQSNMLMAAPTSQQQCGLSETWNKVRTLFQCGYSFSFPCEYRISSREGSGLHRSVLGLADSIFESILDSLLFCQATDDLVPACVFL